MGKIVEKEEEAMATVGRIEILQPLRRVKKVDYIDPEAWLHIITDRGKAIVELDDGTVQCWEAPFFKFIEPYSKDTQYEQRDQTPNPYSQGAWKIVEYVTRLLSNEEISAPDGENAYSIALRVWKEEHETVKEFDRFIRLAREAHQLKPRMTDQWKKEDPDSGAPCQRCGQTAIRSQNEKMCFPCWEKISNILSLLE